MTGLSLLHHEIMEIGAVRVVRSGTTWTITDQKNWLVKPTHIETADPEALKIFGYSESEWKDARSLESVLHEFMEFSRGSFLVGHNSAVDWSFLSLALSTFSIGSTADYHTLDTASMAYILSRGEGSVSLGAIAEQHAIPRARAHRALDDALTTFRVFSALWNSLHEKSSS